MDVDVMRTISSFLIVVAALYAALCLLVFLFQRSFIYFPTGLADPGEGSVRTLQAEGEIQKVSVRPREGSEALIYFGGNAEDVTRTLGPFSEAFPDAAIYMLHYRGYGGSSGRPAEQALHQDADALFRMVREEHARVTVVGRSLGSAVAVRLAAGEPVVRLVLVTPFDSIVNVAKSKFPFLPFGLLLRERFESWRHAPEIHVPTTIVVAGDDEVIPRESSDALFLAFPPGIAEMVIIPGTGHNTISASPDYMAAIRGGLQR